MTSPLVLVAPAMAVRSSFYQPVLDAFEARGWTARALPRRGFEPGGERADRHHDWSYADEIDVLAQAVTRARAEQPDRPVIVMGHSLGGHLAAGNQLVGAPADGIVGVGSGLPYFRHYPVTWPGVLAMGASVRLATALFGYIPKPMFGAPGPRTLMREWGRMITHADIPFAVDHKIAEPSLVIHLAGDTYASSEAVKLYSERFVEHEALTEWYYDRALVPEGGTTPHPLGPQPRARR